MMIAAICSCESSSDEIETEKANTAKLTQKVDSIEKDVCAFMEKVNELEKGVKHQETILDKALPIAGVSLSFVTIIALWIVYHRLSKKIRKLEGDVSSYERQLNFLNARKTNEANSTPYRPGPYQQAYPQEVAIKELENRIQKLEQGLLVNEKQDVSNKEKNTSQTTSIHTEYAMHTKTDIFGDVTSSKQEGSFYVITSTQDGKGKFNIISLAKLQNQDGWDKAIECEGDCKIAEATNFNVESLGLCEKVDGEWKVTRKLKIKIFKK